MEFGWVEINDKEEKNEYRKKIKEEKENLKKMKRIMMKIRRSKRK